MKADLYADMGENVSGIGYRFFDESGAPVGGRVTAGIVNPSTAIYAAFAVTIPPGTRGIIWDDDSGEKRAMAPVEGARIGTETPHETARRLIAEEFFALWPNTFPVVAENTDPPARADVWGMLVVQQAETSSPVVGRDIHTRAPGAVFLCVFIKTGHGTKSATEAADWFARNFDQRTMRDGNVTLQLRESGMIDAGLRGGYTQKNIVCRFQRDCYPSA